MNINGVHKLCELEKIKIKFYKNGFDFETIGFSLYSSKEGRRILGDLMEGYYPFLMKNSFPDGALMEV